MWLICVTAPHIFPYAHEGGAALNPTENIVGHATKLIRLHPQSTRRDAGNRDCRNRRSLIKDPHRAHNLCEILHLVFPPRSLSLYLPLTSPRNISFVAHLSLFKSITWPFKTSTGPVSYCRPLVSDGQFRSLLRPI